MRGVGERSERGEKVERDGTERTLLDKYKQEREFWRCL